MKNEELTFREKMVVGMIIREAKRCLVLNDESGEYEDDGSFIISLEKHELAALTRALRKI